jgi:hypothetical protein
MSRQNVNRTVTAMETLLEAGVEQVSVRRVLRLLGREVSDREHPPEEPQPRLDPRADPITGCLPVTAQGGHDDSSVQEDRRFRQEDRRVGQEDRGARRGGFRA